MTLFLLVIACGYDVDAWWRDLAEAECACTAPGAASACVEDWMEVYAAAGVDDDCGADPAPASRRDVRIWVAEYTDRCEVPADPLPGLDAFVCGGEP